ncbi:MAG TPA: hypothetical protein VN937_17555 [Blastocatellia bacterium]|nr:hypothetical protein [Blastocatellia bacterium]
MTILLIEGYGFAPSSVTMLRSSIAALTITRSKLSSRTRKSRKSR